MKVMAFEAHPDDVEHLCAGTLAKYKASGHEVAIVCVSNGEVGSPKLPKEEIARVREREARESSEVIGAEFFWLNYPDEFIFNTPEIRLHVIDIVRQFDPDIIITLDKDNDYHPDHTTVGQIVWDIHVMGTVPNIKTNTKPCSKIPEIYFMDTAAGINFLPEFYVDITEHWETKKKMISCHKSQDEWCMDQYGIPLSETTRIQSRFRGYQTGCMYAEAFRKPKFFAQKCPVDGLLI